MTRPTARFPAAESVGERDWGEETLLVLSSGNYSMKKLVVKAGKKGGLQYHRKKDEASYIVSGYMLLRYEKDGVLLEKKVGPGDWFHFPAGCIHQEEALTDVVRIEVSTPHFNDRVRVEKDFGIEDDSGLPTTSEAEIELR